LKGFADPNPFNQVNRKEKESRKNISGAQKTENV